MAAGVLCLHGFTGTPFELQPLADAMASAGYVVRSPLLPGHGEDARALAATGWPEWMAGADAALSDLRERTAQPVVIIGGSMGGLLALRLARARPRDVAALVLLAPPLRMRRVEQYGVRVLELIARAAGLGGAATVPKTCGVDVRDPEMRARVPSLREYPLAALANLSALMQSVGEALPGVQAPTLLVHGRLDQTVPLSTSDEIAARLGSAVCERLYLEHSAHLLALDYDRSTLAAAVAAFLDRVAPAWA
jgi:carboxylesterase